MDQSQFGTLNPPDSLFPFPPHRRRYLKSETFCTLVRILSHCYGNSQPPQSHPVAPEEPKRGSNDNEPGQTTELRGDTDGITSTESEMLSIKGSDVHELGLTTKVLGNPDGTTNESELLSINGDASCLKVVNEEEYVSKDAMETDEFYHGNRPNKELLQENGMTIVHSLKEEHFNSCLVSLTANHDTQNVLSETILEDSENVGQVEVDKDHQSCKVSEAFDLSVDMDGAVKTSKLGGNEEKSSSMERTALHPVDSLEKVLGSSFVSLTANHEAHNIFLETLLEDAENVGRVEVDKEHRSCEVTEAFDFSVDMDEIAKFPKLAGNEEDRSSSMERIVLHQVDPEKSLSNGGLMNCPLCTTVDEEVEEGEISGDFVIDDQLMDFLFEDAASSGKKEVEEEQTSETILNEERPTRQNQKGPNKRENKYDKNFEETVGKVGKGVESKLRSSNISDMEYKSEMFVFINGEAKLARGCETVPETVGNQKQADRANEEFKHPAVADKILGEHASANQGILSTDKDADVQKKRKRGPLTEEKKAKKKKKERIKRAEKNRRLGVKRLKIQPVLKPKTVTYCRHYLKGRCQEGDKCKFSHDTTPLTKFKPCCHFARHSCMKGDDCPFDHQLSKYPCNNYLSNGFCSRGTDCLFLHDTPLTGGSSGHVNGSNSEVKMPPVSRVTNSEKRMSLHNTSNQKVHSQPGSAGISSSKKTEQKLAETESKATIPTPKGISKLLFGKSSLSNPSKLNQAGTSERADSGSKVHLHMINSTPNVTSSLNTIKKVTGPVESRGINFLSFVDGPSHDSSKDKDTSSSKQDESLKVGNQISQSKRGMVPNLSEMTKGKNVVPPRGINFLSFGKTPLTNSSNTKIVTSNGDSNVSAATHDGGSASTESVLIPTDQLGKDASSSALRALLSNGPKPGLKPSPSNRSDSSQKALQSTLAFAAKYESRIKVDHPAASE